MAIDIHSPPKVSIVPTQSIIGRTWKLQRTPNSTTMALDDCKRAYDTHLVLVGGTFSPLSTSVGKQIRG